MTAFSESNLSIQFNASGDTPAKATWVDIRDLKAEDFQTDGGWLVQYLERYLAASKMGTISAHSV